MEKEKNKICLTVDVEEYFHAANLKEVCPIKSWHALPSTIENNVERVLDLFDQSNSKGTFFILGYSAKRHPKIVTEITNRGHEIASHGYAHKIAYLQSPKQFFKDIDRSKKLLEDMTGVEVKGYRAPNFSITDKNLWAYDKIIEAGFTYDSSLNPVRHHRYGNISRSASPEYFERASQKLYIFPLTTLLLNNSQLRLPIAGGAYWRVLPLPIITAALSKKFKNSTNSRFAPICYIHPWEIDTHQPYFAKLEASKKLRHYSGISTFEHKTRKILDKFTSVSIAESYLTKEDELTKISKSSIASKEDELNNLSHQKVAA